MCRQWLSKGFRPSFRAFLFSSQSQAVKACQLGLKYTWNSSSFSFSDSLHIIIASVFITLGSSNLNDFSFLSQTVPSCRNIVPGKCPVSGPDWGEGISPEGDKRCHGREVSSFMNSPWCHICKCHNLGMMTILFHLWRDVRAHIEARHGETSHNQNNKISYIVQNHAQEDRDYHSTPQYSTPFAKQEQAL